MRNFFTNVNTPLSQHKQMLQNQFNYTLNLFGILRYIFQTFPWYRRSLLRFIQSNNRENFSTVRLSNFPHFYVTVIFFNFPNFPDLQKSAEIAGNFYWEALAQFIHFISFVEVSKSTEKIKYISVFQLFFIKLRLTSRNIWQ